MNKKSVVVFDFDGVLTKGGEELKQSAWSLLYSIWSKEAHEKLCKEIELQSREGGSRFTILRKTFNSLGATDAVVELLTAAYADCYNTIVQKLLEKSRMQDGTEQVLTYLMKKDYMLFVNSATPEEAVCQSVQQFAITPFFRGIFGQPTSKRDNLERAMKIAQVDKEFMLFVGDGKSDAKAAGEFGCDFVGIPNDWNKWKPETIKFPLIKSIAELPQLLGV